MDEEFVNRCLHWAEEFEKEADLIEKGPNEPAGKPEHPLILKARIESCRGMAADLRKQAHDAVVGQANDAKN